MPSKDLKNKPLVEAILEVKWALTPSAQGAPTDAHTLRQVKDAVPGTFVFANTGVRLETVAEQLAVADGAVVGTTFKGGGKFENHVDEARVKAFMDRVKTLRAHLGTSSP